MWSLIALIFVWIVSLFGCFGCPNHCLCYTWKGFARTDCIRRNLLNTFVAFPQQTEVLDLSYNVITILHGNEFLDANLKYLQDLRLSNNELHQIDKLSFNGLLFLLHLDLSHNYIEYLNPLTFKHNPNLQSLNVSFNPLSVPKGETFLSIGQSLQFLDMSNCRLEFVTSNTFVHLKLLNFLNISKNKIRKIELEFLEGMENLKYLDISKNSIPCNDEIHALLQIFESRRIQYRSLCDRNQKMIMIPVVETGEINQLDSEKSAIYTNNSTQKIPHAMHTIVNDVIQFLRSIPSFYAAVCGVHIGVLIGSFSTYICMKKILRKYKTNSDLEGTDEERAHGPLSGDSDDVNFTLIPLNTPPGTPPSPYHSRFFQSSFSLSTT